jgi:hypothetical protein
MTESAFDEIHLNISIDGTMEPGKCRAFVSFWVSSRSSIQALRSVQGEKKTRDSWSNAGMKTRSSKLRKSGATCRVAASAIRPEGMLSFPAGIS